MERLLAERRASVAAAVSWAAAHPKLARYAAAAVVYGVALVASFHAIVLHPASHLYGPNDGTSTLRNYWAASAQHSTPFSLTRDTSNGAPEGLATTPATIVADGGVQTVFVWVLRGPLGLIGAWNAFLLIGMFATGMVMFWFLERLGCRLLPALLGGYVFAFSPYALERAYAGHLGLLQNWIFPLLALLLLRLHERSSLTTAAVAGLTIAVAFYLSAYQGLFAVLMGSLFLLVELASPQAGRGRLKALGLAAYSALVGVLALIPIFVLYAKERTAVEQTTTHPGTDFYRFAATFSGYFLPSSRNPLFHWLSGINPNLTEDSLFFGYVTLLLALAAVVLLIRRDTWLRATATRRRASVFAALLAPAAFLLSLPPSYRLGSVRLPTPSDLLGHVSTFWRDYARFGLLVGFALVTLAALALSALARRPGRPWRALTPLATLVIVLEILPGNVSTLNGAAVPAWVSWLAQHPRGIVATYPWLFSDEIAQDAWYQIDDRDPLFEFFPFQKATRTTVSGSLRAEAVRLLARDVCCAPTASVLASEGVRYVVIHEDAYRAAGQGTVRLSGSHYTLLATFPNTRIYSVHAPKTNLARLMGSNIAELAGLQSVTAPSLAYGSGYNAPEQYSGRTSRWLIQDGQLELDPQVSTLVSISGLAFSNQEPRLLELRDGSGRVVGRAEVGTNALPIGFGPFLVPAGPAKLTLVALPGPAPLGPSDPRQASVFLEGPLTIATVPAYLVMSDAP